MAVTDITAEALPRAGEKTPSLLARMMQRLQQALCKHDSMPAFDEIGDIQCPTCGKDLTD